MNDCVMQVTIVRNEEGGNSVSTVVLRGSTDSILDDLERAVDDGVNTYKVGFVDCLTFFSYHSDVFVVFVELFIWN